MVLFILLMIREKFCFGKVVWRSLNFKLVGFDRAIAMRRVLMTWRLYLDS